MITFGDRIRSLASDLGKEEQQIANELGLTKSRLSHYINGRSKVPSELLQKIVDIYGINPQYLFDENAPLFKKEESDKMTQYRYFPTTISAGLPIGVDGITESQKITIPAKIMGKWSNHKDVFIVKVNGESMNKVIPNGSLIAVKPVELHELKNNDIVVFSDNGDYSIKKIFHDKNNERVIFRPDSTDNNFYDYIVSYEVAKNLKIHGKVVLYIVELD